MADIAHLGFAIDSTPLKAATSALDSLTRAAKPAADAVKKLETASPLKGFAEGAKGAASSADALTGKLRGIDAAGRQSAQVIALNANAMRNLTFQANDAATMLLSGSSAFQVMATQGGQVLQVLQGANGGVSGALKDIGSRLASFATVGRVAGGALAAVATVGLVAWNSLDNKIKDVQRSLNGLGAGTGATSAGLRSIADDLSRNGPLGAGNALGAVSTFSGAGIYPSVIGGLGTASHRYARAFGQDVPDAQQQLAGIFANPGKGIEKIAEIFGPVDIAIERQIKRYEALGMAEEAQKKLLDELNAKLGQTKDTSGLFGRLWEGTQNLFSRGMNDIGRIGTTPTAAEQLATAQRAESNARALGLDTLADQIKSEFPKLREAIEKETAAAVGRRQQADALRQGRIGAENQYITDIAGNQAVGIVARTSSEKLAVEIERIRIDAIRNSTEAAREAANVERARTLAIADATRALRDHQRMISDEAFMGGARTERDQFIRRMQLDSRDLRERVDVLGATIPDQGALERVRNQIKYSERADQGSPFRTDALGGLIPFAGYSIRELPSIKTAQDALERRGTFDKPAAVAVASDGGTTPANPRIVGTVRADPNNVRRISNDNTPGAVDNGRLAEWDKNKFAQMMFDTGVQINANTRLLDVNRRTFGQSTEEIARQTRQVELENDVLRVGIPLSTERRLEIEKMAVAEGQLAAAREKVQEAQQKIIQSWDFARSTSNDLLSSPLKALARGEKPGEALRQVGQRAGDKLIDMGTSQITEMIFGKSGKGPGGILGGLFGLGGDKNTANMNVNAGNVIVNGGIGGIGGAAGGGGGLFGLIGKAFGFGGGGLDFDGGGADSWTFAKGGVMTPNGPRSLPRFAKGGVSGKAAIFGEAGIEAAVPLPDGRSIPVSIMSKRESIASGGRTPQVNYTGGDMIFTGPVSNDSLPALKAFVQGELQKQNRELRRNFGSYQQHAQENYSG